MSDTRSRELGGWWQGSHPTAWNRDREENRDRWQAGHQWDSRHGWGESRRDWDEEVDNGVYTINTAVPGPIDTGSGPDQDGYVRGNTEFKMADLADARDLRSQRTPRCITPVDQSRCLDVRETAVAGDLPISIGGQTSLPDDRRKKRTNIQDSLDNWGDRTARTDNYTRPAAAMEAESVGQTAGAEEASEGGYTRSFFAPDQPAVAAPPSPPPPSSPEGGSGYDLQYFQSLPQDNTPGGYQKHNVALKWHRDVAERGKETHVFFNNKTGDPVGVFKKGAKTAWSWASDEATVPWSWQGMVAQLEDGSIRKLLQGLDSNASLGKITGCGLEQCEMYDSARHRAAVQEQKDEVKEANDQRRRPAVIPNGPKGGGKWCVWNFVIYLADGKKIHMHPSYRTTWVQCFAGDAPTDPEIPRNGLGRSDGKGTYSHFKKKNGERALRFRPPIIQGRGESKSDGPPPPPANQMPASSSNSRDPPPGPPPQPKTKPTQTTLSTVPVADSSPSPPQVRISSNMPPPQPSSSTAKAKAPHQCCHRHRQRHR